MSIREFADRSRVPYRTLQDYLADKRKPGAEHLAAIARCGIDLHWLLLGAALGMGSALFESDSFRAGVAAPEIASDTELMSYILETAKRVTDQTNKEHIEAHGRSLSLDEIFKLFSKNYRILAFHAEIASDVITKARKLGVSTETIVGMLGEIIQGREKKDTQCDHSGGRGEQG